MDAAEQRWREGEFVPSFVAESAVSIDEHETTLTPSNNTTLEDTLTEQNADRIIPSSQSAVRNDLSIHYNAVEIANSAKECSFGETSTPICKSNDKTKVKDREESLENDDLNDSKNFESVLSDDTDNFVNVSTDDVFEDCVDITLFDDNAKVDAKFDRVEENYSIEMKLALGIEDTK